MTHGDNKTLARRLYELWVSGNSEDPEEILAPGYVNHQEPYAAGGTSALASRDAYMELLGGYHRAFSSSTARILVQLAEGDMVATRWEFTATHTGDYFGLAATDRTVTWTGIQIDRIEGGQIVESWVDWDKFRLFEALGLVQQPPS